MVWYSRLLKNCPQFIVIHTVKGFGIVNKAEIDVFMSSSPHLFSPLSSRSSFHVYSIPFSLCFWQAENIYNDEDPEGSVDPEGQGS